MRVLHTVITERSVSRAAMKLQTSQPAVSAQLRRLRELVGDPLLVRAGTGMAPTEVALSLLGPAETLLGAADALFGAHAAARGFDPAHSEVEFRIAASDYLDPLFLPSLVVRLRELAPGVQVTIVPLTAELDHRSGLARGQIDLVVGNWLEPPEELHLGRLMSDEVVCLVAEGHPAVRNPRTWTAERYLRSEHVAPTALQPGSPGVIDQHLARQGLARQVVVRSPHFGLIPLMVARSQLVLTTGRQFCSRYLGQFPVRIVRCPVAFPTMNYYQLWHDRTHGAAAQRWLRERVRDVARELVGERAGVRGTEGGRPGPRTAPRASPRAPAGPAVAS